MNPILSRFLLVIGQGALILPALMLCSSGAAKLLLGWEAPNDALGTWMNHLAGRILFSPVLVLGGLVTCVVWNLWQICRVSFERIHERWVLCLSVRHQISNLGWLTVGVALLAVVTAYGVVENVAITLRPH
jgi:hypothetical protein